MRDTTFVDLFEERVRARLSDIPGFTFFRQPFSATFHIARPSPTGFGVGATCETWGLYPEPWGLVAWEPLKDWPDSQVIEDYLALVRMQLSPEARIRIIRRRGKIQREILELRDGDGWRPDDDRRHFVLPFGAISEDILQNEYFPSRAPFEGLKKNFCSIYEWRDFNR